MRKKLSVLVAGIMVLMLLLAGCGSKSSTESKNQGEQSKQEGKKTVALIVQALNQDYWYIMAAGAQAAANKYGVDLVVMGPKSETDVEQQFSMIEDQVAKKVAGIVLAPCQPDSVGPVLDKAKAAGIPVVLVDTDAPWDDKVSFIGTGNVAAGKESGKFMADKLATGDKVAIIRGPMGDPTHDQRIQGFKEAVEAKGIKIVADQPANSERGLATSVMENIIQSNPDIKGVFATNDEMAMGAYQALKSANRTDVIVVGLDGSPDALRSILDGGVAATAAQQPYEMGYQGVEAALKALNGESVPKNIDTGTILVTKDNAEERLKTLEEYLKSYPH